MLEIQDYDPQSTFIFGNSISNSGERYPRPRIVFIAGRRLIVTLLKRLYNLPTLTVNPFKSWYSIYINKFITIE